MWYCYTMFTNHTYVVSDKNNPLTILYQIVNNNNASHDKLSVQSICWGIYTFKRESMFLSITNASADKCMSQSL